MATVIERDMHAGSDSSAATAIIAIVAIVLLVGLVLYALRFYPGANNAATTPTDSYQIDVNADVPVTTPPAQQ